MSVVSVSMMDTFLESWSSGLWSHWWLFFSVFNLLRVYELLHSMEAA